MTTVAFDLIHDADSKELKKKTGANSTTVTFSMFSLSRNVLSNTVLVENKP